MITLDDVTVTYAGVPVEASPALNHVSLQIERGQCVVLCGQSGCGKTTLLRLLNGLVPHFYDCCLSGSVQVQDIVTERASLAELAQIVGSVFQNPRTQFFHMDTTGELVFNLENQNMPRETMQRRLTQVVDELALAPLMDRDIFALSGGEKQQIACGSAYAALPQVVVFDEPSANLDGAGIRRLQEMMRTMKNAGITLVISEHRLWYLRDIVDRYVLLAQGRIVREAETATFCQMLQSERLSAGLRPFDEVQLMALPTQGGAAMMQEEGLRIEELRCLRGGRTTLAIEHLVVPRGAVVAVVGANGAGKSTLLQCLCGLLRHHGSIYMCGEPVSASQLMRAAYLVMQEPGHQLFSDSVRDELLLGNQALTPDDAQRMLERLGLAALADCHPGTLSGGQQQRLAIAVALCNRRRLMLYDEPTSGQDEAHLRETAEAICQGNREACCSLVVTHDPELILLCATHLLYLDKGCVRYFGPLDADGLSLMWQICMGRQQTGKDEEHA